MEIKTTLFGTQTVTINKRLKGLNKIVEDIIDQLKTTTGTRQVSNQQRETLHLEIRDQLLGG